MILQSIVKLEHNIARGTSSMSKLVPKLFVFRLHWTVCSDSLRRYFTKFGEVKHAEVKFDFKTGRSRGFGIVRMKTQEAFDTILKEQYHQIDGYEASVKEHRPTVSSQMRQDLTTKPDSSDGNFELSHETVTSNGSSEVRGIHTETAASSEHT